MAKYIKRGDTMLNPFRNGLSIGDSQGKPRIYTTREMFEKHFPTHYLGTDGVELVEFVEVVRCKDCKHSAVAKVFIPGDSTLRDFWQCYCNHPCAELGSDPLVVEPDDFCSYGERKPDISTTPADDDKTDSGFVTEDEYG